MSTSQKTKPVGFCPRCGSGDLIKDSFTTNRTPKQRYTCKACEFRTTTPLKTPPSETVPMRKTLPHVKRYIVTAAQNATPIHKPTWQTLQQMVKYYQPEFVVIPGRYRNPTSQWTQKNQDHEWWDPAVVPYLCDGWIKLNERLLILGDTKVQWAARDPLVGMDALTKDKSGIVGHGSRGLRSIATPQYKHPKLMLTTGACTVRNYTDTKQGKLGAFNHCLGALIIEIDGDAFYVRQLNATKQGHIIDLDLEFTPEGVRPAERALSLSMGDTHYRFIQPHVVKATFDAPDSMMKLLQPKHLFWHDVIDFHSRNHHHKDDPFTRFGKWKFDMEDVRREFTEAVQFMNKNTPPNCMSHVVSSNHDRAAARWLREADYRNDPVNAEFYIEIAKEILASVRRAEGGIAYDDPFITYGRKIAAGNVQFLQQGESCVLAGVEYGFHGDNGPNGSRGSTKNLSKMGIKVTKGHNHTAEIIGGCYSAGKSTGPLEYEQGSPSSHSNSHVVQYANGKRSILFIINGRYCLPRPRKPRAKTPAKTT